MVARTPSFNNISWHLVGIHRSTMVQTEQLGHTSCRVPHLQAGSGGLGSIQLLGGATAGARGK